VTPRPLLPGRRGGFAYIAAVVFLVVLAGVALAALRLSTGSQATVNGQLLGARANQAARGGIEWALYRIKGTGGAAACTNASAGTTVNGAKLTDFRQATGMTVTLTCIVRSYNEGQNPNGSSFTKNIFELTATACNRGSGCPDNTSLADLDYVERKRSASLCIASDGNDCY